MVQEVRLKQCRQVHNHTCITHPLVFQMQKVQAGTQPYMHHTSSGFSYTNSAGRYTTVHASHILCFFRHKQCRQVHNHTCITHPLVFKQLQTFSPSKRLRKSATTMACAAHMVSSRRGLSSHATRWRKWCHMIRGDQSGRCCLQNNTGRSITKHNLSNFDL